tara:strand:+ start:29631 stop:29960 length:330 start_codon:yes stop_codon:yes gene_type:complete
MPVTYTVQITDADYKALCFKTQTPNQYVDDHVTEYIRQMKEEMAQSLIKQELAKPGVRAIPADKEDLISRATIKTLKQIDAIDTERMERLVEDPDAPEINTGENYQLPD